MNTFEQTWGMMNVLINMMVFFYVLAVLFVLFHSLFDAHLIYHYLRSRSKQKKVIAPLEDVPFVTIQLPVYNEMYVVERLLDAAVELDHPPGLLEIQVLDDSTDETSEIIAHKIKTLHHHNIPIHHIQRTNREGFKAGALKHALALAKGKFCAVFDADFLPTKDFLKQTLPFFADPTIGMVQTNWSHINKEQSLLTKLQALALDGHFSIEQQGRNAAGYFINFNGTAGIWRKQTILDAGNWQADTLTEDFDLSYRAQMKGWRFQYLEGLTTPAELPPIISALKSQQFRWTKGGAETAKKNLKTLLTSPLSLSVKLHGTFHLIYSFGFISIIMYALLTVPLLFVKEFYPQYNFIFKLSGFVGLSFFVYFVHYIISYFVHAKGSMANKIAGFLLRFPLFVSLFIGLSLNNALGIMQGYLGIKSNFIRTPKFNAITAKVRLMTNKYAGTRFNWIAITEGLLIFYFLFGIFYAIQFRNFGSIPLLLMSLTGFGMVFFLGIKEKIKKHQNFA